jgi:type I restriction enzyme S subunit
MARNDGVPDISDLQCTSPAIAAVYRRSSVRQGDLIVSIGPSFGKVMIVPSELGGANLTQGTARVAPSSEAVACYVYWALQSRPVVAFWEAAVGGATFRALNVGHLGETPVPMW